MTFLNPFVLFGLAAASIPILLHLLNKRRLRTVEFSSLAFLKQLQKSTMRRITLRQWLLLLLRTLFVILIVLAFARPVLQGSFAGFGARAKTTMVLVVDDSYTMGLQNQQGEYLKQARDAAYHVLGMMKEGDDAALITLSGLPQPASEPTRDPARIRTLLQEMKISPKHRTIEDALRLASRLVAESKNFNKEVYVFTDAQRSTFLNPSGTGRPDGVSEKLFDGRTKVFVLPLSDKPFENCGIVKASPHSSLLQPGKAASIEVTVKNYGTTPVSNRLASLVVNGSRVMQKTVSIASGSSTPVEFSFTPSRAGFQRCSIELEDDAYEADNRYYFTLYVPDQIRIAMIADDETQTPYLNAALAALSQTGSDGNHAFLAINQFAPGRLSSAALNDADLILTCGVKAFGATDGQMIAMAMQNGTGLLFFPGAHTDEERLNADFFPALDIPAAHIVGPAAVQPGTTAQAPAQQPGQSSTQARIAASGAGGVPAQSTAALAQTSFDRIDFDHPIFKGIFETTADTKTPRIESPEIFSQLRFSSQQPLRPIITSGNGTYFLWEKRFGRGTILGFSVPPTEEWSNFVLKPIFIPILSQAILYIGSSVNASVQPGVIGEEVDPRTMLIPRAARRINASIPLRVTDPRGNETKFAATTLDTKGALALAASLAETANEEGFYAITQGRDTVTVVGMNVDEAESDGTLISSGEIKSAIMRYGASPTVLGSGTPIDSTVLESRFGVELWKYFLIFALIIAVIEMLVARESREPNP